MSMCFIRLLSPTLHVSETAPRLSIFRSKGEGSMIPSSQRRSLSQRISCTTGVAPTYSASVDKSATIDWSLLLQQMAPPFIIHTNLDVDQCVSTHPAQSESEKPSIGLSTGFMAMPHEYPMTLPGGDILEEYQMA